LVKIGGKILEDRENLAFTIYQLNEIIKSNIVRKIIIIPGGGSYANFIRKLDNKFKLGNDLAHFMAIYAMELNGRELNKRYTNLLCISRFKKLITTHNSIVIFLPYTFLVKHDEVPHSWEVTSDSISLFLAYKLGINLVLLIKDIDGVYLKEGNKILKETSTRDYKNLIVNNRLANLNIATKKMKKTTPIDSYLLHLIDRYHISCILLNGTPPNYRIIDFFDQSKKEEEKVFTKIIHSPYNF
jgi:aspartokinase-like uncharacterized kinase